MSQHLHEDHQKPMKFNDVSVSVFDDSQIGLEQSYRT